VQSLPPPPASSVTEKTVAVEEGVREESIALLLAGYSYGSLITSRLPSTEKHILPLLTYPGQEKTAFTTALDAARQSARRWWDTHSSTRTSYSGSPVSRAEVLKTVLENNNSASPTTDTRHSWEDSDRKWEVTSSYLLISPPLPPISSCLLGFGSGSWGPSAAGWAKGLLGHHDKHGTMDGAADGDEGFGIEDGAEVLAVYGDGDTFTAVKKYRKWREKMMVSGRWKGVEVEGAGHFWHEDGVGEELERTVKRWTKERDV
jgi:alpha/beta superfamily hydrolase